ncbi:MAG TPA: TOMM precursor leader peptide-binding protein [Thermoanaerobaculia bacterium]|jgi:ribosomal protein S12 methylthiotransferase accessory factor|nr:TOMM precursor leader peptide-binding protein [Thermoanaerobaculia bacterium]
MIQKPRFRRHFHVDCSAAQEVTLFCESGPVRLESPLLRFLAPLIDGRRSAEEIARCLEKELSPIDVAFGLSWLEEQGYVVEAGDEAPAGWEELADALMLDVSAARRRLQERSVAVAAAGDVPVEPLERSLRKLGVRVTGEGDLTVVLAESYLEESLSDFDRRARAGGFSWMLIKPVGTFLWIGPLFEPRQRGCWLCLAERLRAWRRVEGLPESSCVPQPAVDSSVLTGLSLAATEALKWILQGSNPALERTLITFDVRTLASARHAYSPWPGCPVCGPAAPGPPSPPKLQSRSKAFTPGSGDRAATPAATLRRYGHLVSPITGIVDRLTPSREETHDLLHVYTAAYAEPAAPGRSGPRLPRERRRSAGRGITPEQAQAAALCEALERYSGFFQGTESRVEAAWRELGDSAIHPNACLRISDRQLAERDAWNRLDLPYHWLPEPFDEHRPVEWVSAWSLTSGGRKWLPAAYCYYDVPLPPEHRFCRADSNGCAAGSCLEEAILQGFLEIVERDAWALWWYNRAPRPGVRLDSFREPYLVALREWFARLGREVWVLDVTTDFGIPVFVAVSREVPHRAGDLILGAGAHLDPAVALVRALTEVNQFLPGFLAGRPRQILSADPGDAASYLLPDPSRPSRGAEDFPVLTRPDLRDEVELCVDRARRCGLEVLVVDQTREEVGLPVVRVVIPGMRLFRARFAPGRLYDVPVSLGWLEKRLAEPELNPIHVLI